MKPWNPNLATCIATRKTRANEKKANLIREQISLVSICSQNVFRCFSFSKILFTVSCHNSTKVMDGEERDVEDDQSTIVMETVIRLLFRRRRRRKKTRLYNCYCYGLHVPKGGKVGRRWAQQQKGSWGLECSLGDVWYNMMMYMTSLDITRLGIF